MLNEKIAIIKEEDIALARSKVREHCTRLKMSIVSSTKLITAVSEIVRNMIEYASGGILVITELEKIGRKGLKVECIDKGPGIADINLVMKDGYSSKGSLGLGVPGSKRLVNEFQIDSIFGKGTTVTMTQWC